MEKYLAAYRAQKSGARERGIEFKLTFAEWCAFWGDDIDRRGTGAFDLQMQRHGDTGPYALGNISKGTPRQNMKTAGVMKRKRNTEQAGAEHQAALNRAMFEESAPDEDEMTDDERELAALGYGSSFDRRYSFAADHDR